MEIPESTFEYVQKLLEDIEDRVKAIGAQGHLLSSTRNYSMILLNGDIYQRLLQARKLLAGD